MFGWMGEKTGTRGRLLATGCVMAMAVVLNGCSYVPEALDPIEWYKSAEDLVTGRERPEVASPRPRDDSAAEPTAATATSPASKPAEGLVGDKARAKYAEPVRRQGTPSKPLVRREPAAMPAAVQPQTAETPAPQPAPAAPAPEARAPDASAPQAGGTLAEDRVLPQLGHRAQTARDTGPAAPPAQVDMTPPARPDIPATVPGMPRLVKQQFEKRLAESAQTVVRPDVVDVPGRSMAAGSEEPIHLIPPSKRRAGSAKGMAAPEPAPSMGPAASFQVASVGFRDGGAELTRADRQNIAEVARLYRQSGGGVVRVVGIAPAPDFGGNSVDDVMAPYDESIKRAKAVARELTRRGVPGHKIMIGADPTPSALGGDTGARVYLDVI